MTRLSNKNPLRRRVLAEKHVELIHKSTSVRKTDARVLDRTDSKTALMLLLEQQFGKPIEQLIKTGTLKYISKRLGVDPATISKWRQKLYLVAPNYCRLHNYHFEEECPYCQEEPVNGQSQGAVDSRDSSNARTED